MQGATQLISNAREELSSHPDPRHDRCSVGTGRVEQEVEDASAAVFQDTEGVCEFPQHFPGICLRHLNVILPVSGLDDVEAWMKFGQTSLNQEGMLPLRPKAVLDHDVGLPRITVPADIEVRCGVPGFRPCVDREV